MFLNVYMKTCLFLSQMSALLLMFGMDAHVLLVQLLNPKIRYMGDDESHLVVEALRDMYALATHNILVSRERQENQFQTYHVPELHIRDKVLVSSHIRDVWNPKYNAAYCVVCVMG